MRVAILTTLVAAAAASGLVGHGVGLVGHGAVVGHAAVGGLGRGYLGAGRALGVVHAGRAVHGVHGGYADNYAEPRPFHYQYAVDDPHYGPMFNKEEQSDGAGNVQGYYAVNLPDGRTQHVKYVADHYNGYNAEVTYEGYANHPAGGSRLRPRRRPWRGARRSRRGPRSRAWRCARRGPRSRLRLHPGLQERPPLNSSTAARHRG